MELFVLFVVLIILIKELMSLWECRTPETFLEAKRKSLHRLEKLYSNSNNYTTYYILLFVSLIIWITIMIILIKYIINLF